MTSHSLENKENEKMLYRKMPKNGDELSIMGFVHTSPSKEDWTIYPKLAE